MSECTRCGNERKVMSVFTVRPGGHTLPSLMPPELPRSERVCGDCITDDEIVRELGPMVEFVLGVLLKSTALPSVAVAMETVRAFFMVRNNDPDSNRGRQAAVKVLGLDVEQPHSSAKG